MYAASQNPRLASALAAIPAPNRAATERHSGPTVLQCRNLRKRLTRSRWRARVTTNTIAELEAQLGRARANLARHQADARAAEAELLEQSPAELEHVVDVSRGAVSR